MADQDQRRTVARMDAIEFSTELMASAKPGSPEQHRAAFSRRLVANAPWPAPQETP
jgi:hypothetical protein